MNEAILQHAVRILCDNLGSCDYPRCACDNEPHVQKAKEAIQLADAAYDAWMKELGWVCTVIGDRHDKEGL